jgi:hypothetical protein
MFVTLVNRLDEVVLVETQLLEDGSFSSFLLDHGESNRVGDRGEQTHWRWVLGRVSPRHDSDSRSDAANYLVHRRQE